MREPIENEYFNWLCAKVLESNSNIYRDLVHILHTTEFVWVVPLDENRAEDGLELRQDFMRETNTRQDGLWETEPCSIFELLIAFAKRASFQTDIPVKDWFWEFITNLQLEEFRTVSDRDVPEIKHILDTFIWRLYDKNGFGGLFPLQQTKNDQRKIEIWYQWCEYAIERGLV